jgi:hypothetical protein
LGRLWKWLLVVCVAVLLFLGASRLGVWESLLVNLGRWLVVETPLREVDLVVALGGDRGRQVMAVKLLQQGLARQVLFTGADVQPNDYQCLGVPVGQVMALPGPVYTTYEEAVAIRQIVQSHQLGSVLIVTSAYHTRRAYWTFDRVFRGTGVELLIASVPSQRLHDGRLVEEPYGAKTGAHRVYGLGVLLAEVDNEWRAAMIILGINAYHGDVSAVLLRDGALVAAVEEERFRRVKHWAGFPHEAIRVCLDMAGITPTEVDHFAISRDPRAHLWRKALFTLRNQPSLGLVRDRVRKIPVGSVMSLRPLLRRSQ